MPQHQCKAANMLWFAPAFQPVARITDIFEVEPNKMCVASRSNAFATVLFTPQAMQSYQCVFEATLDGLPRYCASLRTTAPHCLWQGSLTHKPSASICPWPVRNQATQQARHRGGQNFIYAPAYITICVLLPVSPTVTPDSHRNVNSVLA